MSSRLIERGVLQVGTTKASLPKPEHDQAIGIALACAVSVEGPTKGAHQRRSFPLFPYSVSKIQREVKAVPIASAVAASDTPRELDTMKFLNQQSKASLPKPEHDQAIGIALACAVSVEGPSKGAHQRRSFSPLRYSVSKIQRESRVVLIASAAATSDTPNASLGQC